jgi:hypothetical protein
LAVGRLVVCRVARWMTRRPCLGFRGLGLVAVFAIGPGFALAVAGAAIVIAPEQPDRCDVEIEAAAVRELVGHGRPLGVQDGSDVGLGDVHGVPSLFF